MASIPLWLVFALQSLVVSGAFVAVILVLSLQMESQYKGSVYDKILLRQELTNNALTTPIITRERSHTQLATRLSLDPTLRLQIGDTLATPTVQQFFNVSYFNIFRDPLAYNIYQHRLIPNITDPTGSGFSALYYQVAGMTSDLILGVSDLNDRVTIARNPTYPLQFATTFRVPLVVRGTIGSTHDYPHWGEASIIPAGSVSSIPKFTVRLMHPIAFNATANAASFALSYTIDVMYLVGLATQAALTPSSSLLLVGGSGDKILCNVNAGTTLFNDANVTTWSLDTLPNQAIVHSFRKANGVCSVSFNCTYYTGEEGSNLVSLQHMTTDYNFQMSLLQITPRSFYFADGERSIAIGIVIGVVAAVAVLVTCVVIWFAVRGPVRRLRESMELAAVMRNDEVSDTSSVLTELDLLGRSFTQMNEKLLQARAFMPQSMLYNGSAGELEEDEFGESEGESAPSYVDLHGSGVDSSNALRTSRSSLESKTSANKSPRIHHESKLLTLNVESPPQPLLSKKVAVLIINARGTHELAAVGGALGLGHAQVQLVDLVERCARAEKGVVDAFQGDHFVVTFNAARAVGAPGRNGALVGLAIEAGAQRDGLVLGKFSMGLSVGRALVGNVGSVTMKKNCTVGNVYTNATGLERLAKRVGWTCVTNGRSHGEIDVVAYCQLLGRLSLFGEIDTVFAVAASTAKCADDEWLYEMAATSKANPYHDFNQCVVALLEGRVTEATNDLNELQIRLSPSRLLNDVVALFDRVNSGSNHDDLLTHTIS